MVQDSTSSSVVTTTTSSSSPLMSLSPPWLRAADALTSDERGLCLIHLLLNCASLVSANSLDAANAVLDQIALLSSPDGDVMQRIAAFFTSALARRLLRPWPGLYRSLLSTSSPSPPDLALARRHFLEICPFLRLSYLISNQAILEAMDAEKMIHVIDLDLSSPSQWLALMQALASRPGGPPPHLRVTGVNESRDVLTHVAAVLSDQAEKLDIPFQFNPVVAKLDTAGGIDFERFRVKTGEALAISSVLQLHPLLACRSSTSSHHDDYDANKRLVSMKADAAAAPEDSCAIRSFLEGLWGLSPKIMVVAEQESNHNGATMNERFVEALNYYAALFDCLESTVGRQSVERVRVERVLFGEEIKGIIACEGPERKERHEKHDRWAQRLEGAGFGRVPLSYFALLQARRMVQGFGGCADGYKVKDHNGCFFICWHDRPLYSVSAWSCRRFD